jgi:cytochrome c-type biogenesis protein CcmH/NrfG
MAMIDRRWLYGIVGLAAAAVLAAAGGLYLKMYSSGGDPAAGAPRTAAGVPREQATAGNAVPQKAIPSIEAAAERLAQRLKANDGSGDDWALLARSYVQMRRWPEAVEAFDKALAKMPGDQALTTERDAARKAAQGENPPAK